MSTQTSQQPGLNWQTVAAGETATPLVATGVGSYLSHIVIQPAATTAGTVIVYDNATAIYTYTTGTLADLSPKTVPFGCRARIGAFKITTGATVAVAAFFTP